jgi:DNA-binding NarL/FixJ family response regulator
LRGSVAHFSLSAQGCGPFAREHSGKNAQKPFACPEKRITSAELFVVRSTSMMVESPKSEPIADDEVRSGELIRIVIADDHPIFRDGLRKLLTLEADFRVVAEAPDGKDVLEVLGEHQPDILLLDLNMPGLDGLAVLKNLQNSRTKTKVILLTASEDNNQFVQAMKFGTCGIVLKQTATDLLIKSIRKVHAGEIWLDSHTTAAVMRQASSAIKPPSLGGRDRDRNRSLSQREREIVALVAQGFKNKEMAEKMFISEQTVKNHLHNIFDKLGVSDRLELALYAIHKNIHTSV